MKKIIIASIVFAFAGCCEKVQAPVKAELPNIEEAKTGSNDAETLENILHELDLRRAIQNNF